MNAPLFFSDSEKTRWTAVRGWLLPNAAECLHRYARESSTDGQIVEIGSFAGKSSVCIGHAIQGKNQPMTCIDLRFQPDFRRNLADFGMDARVSLLEGPSLDHFEFWDAPISFLYIDGHHGKGYAMADLLLWDMFVLPGGYVALDDTAGFMMGPNLQVQAMMSGGAYEFLEERGGISFLRKNRGLSPLTCHVTTAAVWFARLHTTSAHLGAMDPLFRHPRLPQQPMPVSEWIDRLWHTSPAETMNLLSRKIRHLAPKLRSKGKNAMSGVATPSSASSEMDWLRKHKHVIANAIPTLNYLDACCTLREEGAEKAIPLFNTLAKSPADTNFVHYQLSVPMVSKLRLAQCHDLIGNRDKAAELFAELDTEENDALLRITAKPWITNRFTITSSGNPLLREYNLVWSERKIQKS
jgi:hypothetical protein